MTASRFFRGVYRAFLRLYPADFRERYGGEAWLVFEAEHRALETASLLRRWRHAGSALLDLAAGAALERMDLLRSRLAERQLPANVARRERRGWSMDGIVRDFRHALRSFARTPGFAAIAVLTIGLGIGANTAIFSVVRAVLLRPLPYADPDRLVLVLGEMTNRNVQYWPTSPPDLLEYRAQVTRLSQLEAVFTFAQPMTGDGRDAEEVQVAGVTPGFLQMLGGRPVLGRLFTTDDAAPVAEDTPPGEGPPVMVVISNELWQRRFGGDADVIGRALQLGGQALVVGVLERGFRLHMPPGAGLSTDIDVWAAPRLNPATWNRNNVLFQMVGRRADGASIAQVQQQVDAAVNRIRADNPRAEAAGLRQHVVPMHEDLTREVRPIVLAFLGAVGFVLLIACANVSNLLVVRASVRAREMAVRSALGGSRAGIARLVLSESLLLAVAGGLLGLLLAAGGIRLLLAMQPPDLPRLSTVSIDAVVLGYTALAALIAAAVFGLMPALQASRSDLGHLLKDRGASAGGRAQGRLRAGVVVLEVALSLVLLIGAGLMVRSFMALRAVDPGYDAERLLTFQVQLPFQRYDTPEKRLQFITRFREQLGALAGATSASAASPLPLTGAVSNGPYGTEAVLSNPNLFQQAEVRVITQGYFEAMGTRILEGRSFTDADRSDNSGYVVVDRTLANKTWPGESAVGKQLMIRFGGPEYVPVHVIGVVEHQRSGSLASEGREAIYYHDAYAGGPGNMSWIVRSDGDPARLTSAARAALAEIDASVPMYNVRTMQDYVNTAMGPTQFALALIGIFGVTALVLAAVGLYGVIAYSVRQRTAEIGIRMTFGAERATILRMIIVHGLQLTLTGVAVGVLAALGLTRVIESQLVNIRATDPATFITVAAVFFAVAALACTLPALRATRVDPLTALRTE